MIIVYLQHSLEWS